MSPRVHPRIARVRTVRHDAGSPFASGQHRADLPFCFPYAQQITVEEPVSAACEQDQRVYIGQDRSEITESHAHGAASRRRILRILAGEIS